MGTTLGKWIPQRLCGRREVKVLMIGLDAAGKITVLYKLKLGEVVTTIPTIGFNVETIQVGDANVTAFDVGLRNKMRPLLRHYYADTDRLVFVVDSTDLERLDEVIELFNEVLGEPELLGVPCLVMANKQDCPNASPPEELAEKLGLLGVTNRKWKIIPCSAVQGVGLIEGLEWLTGAITQRVATKDVTQSLTTSAKDVSRTAGLVQEKAGHYGRDLLYAGLGWIQQFTGCKR